MTTAGGRLYVPVRPVRFVTSTALFDGHDAAINIMRRILQSQGAEVVHLGHDRSVAEVVSAVLEEDAQGVAVSSYQGGHVEYFEFLAAQLKQAGAGHVKIFGGGGGVMIPAEIQRLRGGGGVILPAEIERLAAAGVRIFSPEDGQRLGLAGMINELIRDCDTDLAAPAPGAGAGLAGGAAGAGAGGGGGRRRGARGGGLPRPGGGRPARPGRPGPQSRCDRPAGPGA